MPEVFTPVTTPASVTEATLISESTPGIAGATATVVVPAVAPVAATVAATPAAATTPAITAPSPDAPTNEPTWLTERLKRAAENGRKAALKDVFGDEDFDKAKASAEDLRKRRDAEKTEAQRLTDENASLKAKAARADDFEAIYRAQVDAQLAALTQVQRDLVTELAGDDVAKRAKTIERMRASGMFNPTAVAVAAPVVAVAPVSQATTAPAASAPAPAAAGVVSHLATYDSLKKQNPMLAATYRLQNLAAIQAEKQSLAKP